MFMIFFPFIAMLMIFMVEYSIQTIYFNKMTTVSEFAVKTAENEGAISSSVIEKIEYRMMQEGLSEDKFQLEYQEIPQINYNQAFEFNIKGTFTYHALNMLGTGIGNIHKTMQASNIGYSNVWHR